MKIRDITGENREKGKRKKKEEEGKKKKKEGINCTPPIPIKLSPFYFHTC